MPIIYNVSEEKLREFVDDVLKADSTNESVAAKWLSPDLNRMENFVVVKFAETKFLFGRQFYNKTRQFIDKQLMIKWGAYIGSTLCFKPIVLNYYSAAQKLMLAETSPAFINGVMETDLFNWIIEIESDPEMKKELNKLLVEDLGFFHRYSMREETINDYMYNIDRDEFTKLYEWIKNESPEFQLIKNTYLPNINNDSLEEEEECIVKLEHYIR